ncbi:hypothetical protein VTL71DRAFT_16441 [Oculimacula yallundae]|uniref:DUF6594 domain-containing protein n=1 Tax=Oculimacula yallundae TaxID=86028 RepID=A0ABR4CEG4_9HELO
MNSFDQPRSPKPEMGGYAKIASLMADHSAQASFQRFGFLNMLDLLYRQAELVHLEEELREYMKGDLDSKVEDSVGTGTGTSHDSGEAGEIEDKEQEMEISASVHEIETNPRSQSAGLASASMSNSDSDSDANDRFEGTRNWWYLSHTSHSATWEHMLKTREKLKEYNDTLLLQTRLASCSSPIDSDIHFLSRWFRDPKMGNSPLRGKDREVYNSPIRDSLSGKHRKLYDASVRASLLAVDHQEEQDPLAHLFLGKMTGWYHHFIGTYLCFPSPKSPSSRSSALPSSVIYPPMNDSIPTLIDEEAQFHVYSNTKILLAANVLGSLISSSLLVGSIVALYFVDDMLARLGIIAAFTQVFSLVLVLVTRARKVEVFAATAAFMAVQVVFIGSTSPYVSISD